MEALYFVPEPETAIAEAARVLKPAGKLFIASANRDWTSFNAAPFTSRYLNAGELKECFANNGLSADISFGFPEGKRGLKSKALSLARKAVVKMHLIPDTMEGKEKLKKLAYGKLEPLPAEFSEISETTETFVSDEYAINSNIYKVVYAIGTKG
jgi:ubiquinone/menaquinone biosynthesis C-methylase UbiE